MSPSAGDCWYHIPSPSKQKLKQVSVGRTSVYTVDENGKAPSCLIFFPFFGREFRSILYILCGHIFSFFYPGNLWYRQGLTPSYPQGSSWEHISNNVRKVSVGPLDQVSTKISIFIIILFQSHWSCVVLSFFCQFDWCALDVQTWQMFSFSFSTYHCLALINYLEYIPQNKMYQKMDV